MPYGLFRTSYSLRSVLNVCHWHTAPHNPVRYSYIVKLALHFYAQEDFFMNKKTEQELVSLTKTCLKKYWEKDCSFILDRCADNVLWIGAEQPEYLPGIEAVTQNFYSLMEAIQPCIIANGEFNVVQNQGASCTICGRYLVQTSPEADYFLQAEQRCTFVWELISDTPKIRHMHVSNPMGELKIADGSRFVNEIGQMAKKYLEEKIQDLTGSQIVVPRRDGGTIFLLLRDILYAEARLRYCEVSLENGEQITLNMSLTEFAKLTDDYFVKVHRSYLVNIRHVSTICPYEITMQNGLRIPVPQKKYTAVRQMLMKRHVPGDH